MKFKLSNGSGCRKEDVMVLGNGVVIVIQDKDAYCPRWGVCEVQMKEVPALTLSAVRKKTRVFTCKNFTSGETFFPQM